MGIGGKISASSIQSTFSNISLESAESGNSTNKTHIYQLKAQKSLRDRAVKKDGTCNFYPRNLPKHGTKFITDIFTTFLDLKWRWLIFSFCVSYFISWIGFGVAWWGLLYLHGDLDRLSNDTILPCVTEIHSFDEAFLFAVETQQTVGYGYYHITTECPVATILMCFQSIVGLILEGIMVGLIFVKVSQGKKRSETILFSEKAVIAKRDGVFYFMFRVGDMRKSHMLDANVRAQFICRRTTLEGEIINYNQQEMPVKANYVCGDSRLLLLWPIIVCHKIDSSSPLYKVTPHDLHRCNLEFEIVVVLEGVVEATGNSAQARTSYLPGEIKWGHLFKSTVQDSHHKESDRHRLINYAFFHETVPIEMPRYSAYELQQMRKPSEVIAEEDDECEQ